MCGKTHIEGGRLAFSLTATLCYFLSPLHKQNLFVNILALLLIHLTTNYSSTMKDLDHAESNIGNAPIFSYMIFGICHKVDRKHRSIFTHNILIDIILWLLPSIIIITLKFKTSYASIEVMYLIVCSLLGMFFGNLSHIILDMFTVEGIFKPLAFIKLMICRFSGASEEQAKRDIGRIRSLYRTNLVVKRHSFVFMLGRPYIKRINIEDYGKTGGPYEEVFRANLQTLNCITTHLVILMAFGPNFRNILNIITHG